MDRDGQPLQLRGRTVRISSEPLLMGIVNASPDSFSDPGGRSPEQIAQHARELAAAGAALIDVGGESGRTDTQAVPEDEEAARVVPVIERLAADGLVVSVDTWRAPVAAAALAAGAAMVNDVSGLADPRLAEACAETGAALVITHTRLPPKRKGFPHYADVVEDVATFLRERADEARRRGVRPEQIVFDPGLDLAKTPAQSLELIRRLAELRGLGRPLLLAISRKDFVGALTERPPRERLAGTLAALGEAVDSGAAILRVHDVAAARDYLRVRAALQGESPVPTDLRLDASLRRERGEPPPKR
jgi:dihydropteroate synthase